MPDREERDTVVWIGWMFLFGMLGVLAAIGVQYWVENWCEADEIRQSHAWMTEQMGHLRRGKIDCLVSPDSRFVSELLADPACASKVRDLYVGGDLSDPRLGRLRELPNLRCIVLLFANNHNAFLRSLSGMKTIEEITVERTLFDRDDIDCIGRFPHLKSLSLTYWRQSCSLEGLRGHPTLERLRITRSGSNLDMIPVFKTMPHLREVAIGVCSDDATKVPLGSFESKLREALPGCNCRVWDDCK